MLMTPAALPPARRTVPAISAVASRLLETCPVIVSQHEAAALGTRAPTALSVRIVLVQTVLTFIRYLAVADAASKQRSARGAPDALAASASKWPQYVRGLLQDVSTERSPRRRPSGRQRKSRSFLKVCRVINERLRAVLRLRTRCNSTLMARRHITKSVCIPRGAWPVSAGLSCLSPLVRAPLRKRTASVGAADLLNLCGRAVHALRRQNSAEPRTRPSN